MITPAVEKKKKHKDTRTAETGESNSGDPDRERRGKQRGASYVDEPDFLSEKGKYQNRQRIAGARDSPAELTQPACSDRDETPHQACSYPKETLRRGDVTP
ncbi:hypothetical protein DPEC_G00069610 [Dallia pectoralis]|uniref:Uncharacterized protein n=1 Tax=Dallia pectoralis TaxID=75939 RepID=A0ACC2H231_DALPE|nr:hypothetical protein DPEC_G00069610 [Dallia pectoralis]